jgi:hypothetical protein
MFFFVFLIAFGFAGYYGKPKQTYEREKTMSKLIETFPKLNEKVISTDCWCRVTLTAINAAKTVK